MNYLIALICAGFMGICVALEPTVNSNLGKMITPRLAVFHSFIVGTLIVTLMIAFTGGFKEYKLITKAPPYLWIGGILGLIIVYLGTRVTLVLGIASTLTIMVSAQLITGIVIDSFGLFGTAKVPVDVSRVIGVVLIVIAVKLIVK